MDGIPDCLGLYARGDDSAGPELRATDLPKGGTVRASKIRGKTVYHSSYSRKSAARSNIAKRVPTLDHVQPCRMIGFSCSDPAASSSGGASFSSRTGPFPWEIGRSTC